MTAGQSIAFPAFDGRHVARRGGAGRWRRNAVTIGLALAVHAGLLWVLAGRAPGIESRSSTFDMAFVDPLAIPVTLPDGGWTSAPPGGGQAPGDRASETAPETGLGDGTSEDGQGGKPNARDLGADAARTATAPGDASEARQGLSDPFADGPLGAAANNAYQRQLLRHIRAFRLYPSEAVSRRAEGVVIVRFRITRGGEIEEAWVVKRSRDSALDRAALDTLWRAEPMPAVPDGLPAPMEVELPVPFRLPGK